MKTAVQKIFDEVAPTYERVNRVLTLGMDGLWRKKAARAAAQAGGKLWLDVCSGTGDMAQNLARLAPAGTKIIGLDFSPAMLRKASEKSKAAAAFVMSDVKALPFPSGLFDLITISFATRNINLSKHLLRRTFQELRRVLAPGGRLVNLETSQPKSPAVRKIFHFYVRTMVKQVGTRLSGSEAGYTYLASTIPRFYDADDFSKLLGQAGFCAVSCRPLFFGAITIHTAVKMS